MRKFFTQKKNTCLLLALYVLKYNHRVEKTTESEKRVIREK